MAYKIAVASSAEKSLSKIAKRNREQIIEKIESLKEDPRPNGCKKLQGSKKQEFYRIRHGDYRIVYTIQDEILLILIVDIGHRKEIYR